jgi:hypothetical protein
MLFRPSLFSLAFFGLGFSAAGPSFAQTERAFPACPSQQGVEQVVGSQGRFVPSDCRQLTITRVQSGTTELCVLNFEPGGDPGFLDKLRSAAVPTQWWVSCDNLARR